MIIGVIIMLLVFFLFVYKWKSYDHVVVEDKKIITNVSVITSKIDEKFQIVYKYYIDKFIGDKIKDDEWLKKNNWVGDEIPVFRRYTIMNNPETQEGMEFLSQIRYIERKYDRAKKTDTSTMIIKPLCIGKYTESQLIIEELSEIRDEIDDLFPEVFLPIKRDEKLKELGI